MADELLWIHIYFACRKLANYRLSLGSIFVGGSEKEKEIRTWEYEVTKKNYNLHYRLRFSAVI